MNHVLVLVGVILVLAPICVTVVEICRRPPKLAEALWDAELQQAAERQAAERKAAAERRSAEREASAERQDTVRQEVADRRQQEALERYTADLRRALERSLLPELRVSTDRQKRCSWCVYYVDRWSSSGDQQGWCGRHRVLLHHTDQMACDDWCERE